MRPSKAALRASVTSIVLASASFTTDTPMAGLPLVREILEGVPSVKTTSATSPSNTWPEGEARTTKFRMSSTESRVWVVLTGTELTAPDMRPAGRVTLFSLRAAATCGRETPLACIRSGSTATCTCRSTSPATMTSMIPSMAEISGTIRDRTTSERFPMPSSETTLNCNTGNWSGSNRPTSGLSAPPGKVSPPTTDSM